MSLTSILFKAARASASGRAVRRGRTGKRLANKAKGRAIGRAGGWSKLWK